jgi:pyruvate dehydrogenase E2 component (dihydrolipoamide acetyltransferase)
MAIEIVMPKLGLTMTEAMLVEWKKREGDRVKKGEILFVLETEKVTYEVEAPEDGILGKVLVHEKETVPVGAVVAYLLAPGERPSEDRKAQERLSPEGWAPREAPIRAGEEPGTRVKASPLAAKIARAAGIDLRAVTGTGPGGRILREDVEKVAFEKTRVQAREGKTEAVTGIRPVALSGMRRAIAKKMLAAKVETAQTYMSVTVDAGRIVAYRETLLPYIQERAGVRVTITDLMMKVTGAAIREHPVVNTRWTPEGILYLDEVHMGMAMALDAGLIVPVIRDIHQKNLTQIARDRTTLIEKGKNNRFMPDDITGSTFTLSAMGMFGIEQFTANINLPESAILAVGAVIDKPVAAGGQVVIRPMMNVTLTYDHRIIDGAEAGKFMRTLKRLIEDPILVLA